jgi:hypothetical protein
MSTATLEIDEDQNFERREYWFERVGQLAMLLLAIAALTGVLGRGPLSKRSVYTENLKIDFEHFIRKSADTQITVHMNTSGGKQSFWLDKEFLEKVEVTRIEPEPENKVVGEHGIQYQFATLAKQSGDIVIQFQPETWGRMQAKIKDDAGNIALLNFLAYP